MPPSRQSSTAAASTSSSTSRPNLRGVDQSLNIMRQVKSYFNVGMDNVLDVATDMAEYGKGEESHVIKLRNIMLSYVKMESDLDKFMAAASQVVEEAAGESSNLESALEEKLEALGQDNNEGNLKQHEKYQELEQKIWDSQHPDAVPFSLSASAPIVEDDIEMTQENMNTKCPYTLQEMVNPVRNKICKHNYDKTGILEYIKRRGKKATCPVIGCANQKPITSSDLEDNKDMRRYIQRKNKQLPVSSAASASVGSECTTEPSDNNAVVIHEG